MMKADDFEWDDAKAAANLAKHGVSFEQARDAFDDPFAIDFVDDREDYGEERLILFGMVESRLLVVACMLRAMRCELSRRAKQSRMSDANIMKRTAKKTTGAKHDWSRLDKMTEAEKHAAALSDPDNRPLTEADMKRMKRTLGTLRDWEQGRAEPDQAARGLPDRDRPRAGRGT